MIFNAEVTWRVAGEDPLLAAYFTKAEVSAPDELTAKRTIEHEFSSQLSQLYFPKPPQVVFVKIKLAAAASNLKLVGGYGV